MQATSSQVIPATSDAAPLFLTSDFDTVSALIIPVELKQAARESGRDHLLVRRRRRHTRLAGR
ncbi:MAG: hypothetical protein AAFY82_09000 [Pseudomonadota bacterium]